MSRFVKMATLQELTPGGAKEVDSRAGFLRYSMSTARFRPLMESARTRGSARRRRTRRDDRDLPLAWLAI